MFANLIEERINTQNCKLLSGQKMSLLCSQPFIAYITGPFLLNTVY